MLLEINLPPELAKKLAEGVRAGKLAHVGIVSAELTDNFSALSDQIKQLSHPTELLHQAVGGDKGALGSLLELHGVYLNTLAAREIKDGLEARLSASDMVQQTYLSAFRNFQHFKGRQIGEFVAWLRRILDMNLKDAIRQHVYADRRSVKTEQMLEKRWEQELAASSDSSPSTQAMTDERAVELALALEELPADQREAVCLRHLEGLSLAEIADRLNRSEPATAGLIMRGMQQLRTRLKDDDHETK